MASAASSTAPAIAKGAVHGVAPLRAGQGTSFVLRRLHSLSGIVPVGAFLFEHVLISNSTAISGPDAYAKQVAFSAVFRWYFFLSCSGSGYPSHSTPCMVSTSGTAAKGIRSNIPGPETGCTRCSAGPAASLSSTSSGIHTRCASPALTCTTYPNASFGKVQAELMNPALLAFYVIGLIAACWHFAYGVWLFAAKWGITSGEKARQRIFESLPGIIPTDDRGRAGEPLYLPGALPATHRGTWHTCDAIPSRGSIE